MLPGFRFLFAAVVLSMSILVFGLGAAALLRAAHEEFASNPTWRAAPETVFAQPVETTRPVLALLRVDAPVMENTPDNTPADATSAAIPSASAEPERIAALTPEDSAPPETIRPEMPAVESPQQNEASSAALPVAETGIGETKIAEAKIAETKTPETKTAISEEFSLAADQAAVPPAFEPIGKPFSPDAGIAAINIATLGGPAIAISPPAKIDSAKSNASAIKKHLQARRAARRRRLAARARLAAQLAQLPQQQVNPFGLPAPAPTIVRRR